MSRINGSMLKSFALDWKLIDEHNYAKSLGSGTLATLAEKKIKKLTKDFAELNDEDYLEDPKDKLIVKDHLRILPNRYGLGLSAVKKTTIKNSMKNLNKNKKEDRKKILSRYNSVWYFKPNKWNTKQEVINNNDYDFKIFKTYNQIPHKENESNLKNRYESAILQIENLTSARNYANYLLSHKLRLPNYLKSFSKSLLPDIRRNNPS